MQQERFSIEYKNCRLHGAAHLHVKACVTCLAVIDSGECSGDSGHPVTFSQKPLGTWFETERWRCVEAMAA